MISVQSLLHAVFIGLICCVSSVVIAQEEYSVTAECTGLSDEEGSVVLAIYSPDDDFPDEPMAFISVKKEKGQDQLMVTLPGIPVGEYAATLLHDEDGDERMDSNLIGIPREGFAFSNNAQPSILGAPSFSKCTFKVSGNTSIQMEMIYF